MKVAIKLGIQLIYLDQHLLDCPFPENKTEAARTFEIIWNDICNLAGHRIANSRVSYHSKATS